MRTWFLKLRISATIDAGKPLSPGLQQKVARSPEAARFAETALSLDRVLGQSPAHPKAPDALHDTIMRAVRATERQPASRPTLAAPLRFAAAGAAAIGIVLLLAGLWPATPLPRRWADRPSRRLRPLLPPLIWDNSWLKPCPRRSCPLSPTNSNT